jgi:hypothetical protein
VYDLKVPGLQPREFLVTQLWSKIEENTVVIACQDVDLSDDFSANSKYVRGSSAIFWKFERLPRLAGVEQTRSTWTQQVDLKGFIPKAAVDSNVVSQLAYMSLTRKQFDKSLEIDADNRARTVEMIENHSAAYSAEENKAIDAELENAALFKNGKVKKSKALSPTIENSVVFKPGERLGVGRSETTVRATKEQVLSFIWDVSARCRWSDSDMERSVLATKNDHHYIGYTCKRGSHGAGLKLLPREGVSTALWRRENDGALVFVGVPTEHDLAEPKPSMRVRAKMPTSFTIKKTSSPGMCKIVYISQLDIGGRVPAWAMNKILIQNLSLTHRVQSYFQELRTLEEYDATDGKALGIRLMFPGGPKNKKRWGMVDAIVDSHAGLRKMANTYPWLKAFLVAIVRGQLSFAASVSTKLECLSVIEASKIGRSLAPALKARKTPEAGLYQWKMQNRSMIELFKQYPWTEDMLLAIAKEVLKTAPWGLAWRVSTGAFLSILDMATDLNMIVLYMSTPGQENLGHILLAMFVACLALQLMMTIVQNLKKKERLPREMLVAVVGLKPVWDCYNVVRGKAQDDSMVDAKTELVFTKGIELL